MRDYNFYVYILTNLRKTVVYIGVTNNLKRRIAEHENHRNPGFTQKYKCHYLVYYEHFTDINLAIRREKELKKWNREKKDRLISAFNPDWKFLNNEVSRYAGLSLRSR